MYLYDESKFDVVMIDVRNVTLDNRQEIIEKILNQMYKDGRIIGKKYRGLTNEEIKDYYEDVYEFPEGTALDSTIKEVDGELNVYLKDNKNKEYLIGNIPKNKIKTFLNCYENNWKLEIVSSKGTWKGYDIGGFFDEYIKNFKITVVFSKEK